MKKKNQKLLIKEKLNIDIMKSLTNNEVFHNDKLPNKKKLNNKFTTTFIKPGIY